ncbi:MAG: hypothetical protein BGO90_11670 [Legionella sp. 40-6]|nr:hypothetical protein [Legionella sp.]OJY09257.1 MAG: hypothetical protein BGO90_11670 [Legionella sp. 40-6]
MIAPSGFFKTTAASNQHQDHYQVIQVGGKPFHAFAVAFIDYVENGHPVQEATIKKILGRFYQYFPEYVRSGHLSTPKERLSQLLHHARKAELVEHLAYVFRQVAVDELYAEPKNLAYREAFAELSPQTPKDFLRENTTPLPSCALKALAKQLNMPLILSYTESGKDLRKYEASNSLNSPALKISIQSGRFYPAVRHVQEFNYVGQLNITVKPQPIAAEHEGTLAQVLQQIHESDMQLLQTYQQHYHQLDSMMKAQELSYHDLRESYIHLFPYNEQEAAYLRVLEEKMHPQTGNGDALVVKVPQMMIKALASWMTVGAVNDEQLEERLFNRLDAVPTPAPGH